MTAQARLLGGRYQVGELLGYGGMAEVHRGRDLRLGRDVAIKMLRTDLARDATFQLRFRREAQNAASLNHPAIVAVYDTGEERGPTGEDAAVHRHGVRQRAHPQGGAHGRGAADAPARAGDRPPTSARRWSSATGTASSTGTSSPAT